MTRYHNYADVLVHYVKAGAEQLEPDELRALANSAYERVRMRVAENVRTPKDVLELLAGDTAADVRSAVALNPRCPKPLRERIAADDDATVRYAIAEDPSTPIYILRRLADDPNPYVSVRARRTLSSRTERSIARQVAGKRMLRLVERALPRSNKLQFA